MRNNFHLRVLLKKILRRPISFMANKLSSRPSKVLVHQSLTKLYEDILKEPGKKGRIIGFSEKDKFIIFSDQHKGQKNGADLFTLAEPNYLAALDYYASQNYFYIDLGDCEDFWGNTIDSIKKNYDRSFDRERIFLERDSFVKIFGNHDLSWSTDLLSGVNLESIYGQKIKVWEGIILKTVINSKELTLFLTHGHQGDLQSDGNWFSKWFVSNVWYPLQVYLSLNLNVPSVDDHLKTLHNEFMYEWIAHKKNLLLITGHTHQPVFASLTHLEKIMKKIFETDKSDTVQLKELEGQLNLIPHEDKIKPDFSNYKPNYFNSGCCCFNDGDITGIEIENGFIRLIKWEYEENVLPSRKILEEAALDSFIE